MDSYEFGECTTDLDTHANMCVFGKNCVILSETGRTVDVNAFETEAGGLNEVPIVDVKIAYDCPRTSKVFFLVARNVLYVDSTENNLIPSFVLREAGILLQNIPTIHWREKR